MIITVPAGMSPLFVIADVESVQDARIFVDEAVIQTIRETSYNEINCYEGENLFQLNYEVLGNEYYDRLDEISISDTPSCRTWYKVREFKFGDKSSKNYKFYKAPRNPKITIHVKMA